MLFSFAIDIGSVFPFLFDDIRTCYRGVIAATLSLYPTVPKTSLIVLVFFANLTLVGRRLIVLTTRYINKKSVSRFIFSKVILFLFVGLYPWKYFELISQIPEISCSNVFVSALTVFLTAFSQKSSV